MYSRYLPQHDNFRPTAPRQGQAKGGSPFSLAGLLQLGKEKPPAIPEGGFNHLLRDILPDDVDLGDLLLLAILLLLYLESHDEEFLIILLVVGYSIFFKRPDPSALSEA